MRAVSRLPSLALAGCLSLIVFGVAAAQKITQLGQATLKTYHPTITSLSTRTPTPGQIVTISGSDLLPPTWTVKVQYHDRYGTQFHELPLSGSSTALTFAAPRNLRPDSIAIQYTNASTIEAANNPIPQTEQRPFLPVILVQQRPEIDSLSIGSVQGGGGSFRVLTPGSRTVKGKFFLKMPELTVTLAGGTTGGIISQPTFTTTSTIDQGPTVTVVGTSASVSSVQYIPTTRDEVTIAIPTTLPHNATGVLKFSTPAGSDSTRLTIVQPPGSATVLETITASTPVTDGQLVLGRQYLIRGQNLVIRQRQVDGSFNVNMPTVSIGGIILNQLNTVSVASPSSDTLVNFSMPANLLTSGGALVLSHAGGSVTVGSFAVIAQPPPLQISGAVISPNDIIAGTSATITLSLSPSPTNFSTAGDLAISIPSSLSSAIAPMSSVPITANPMTITVPTRVIQTTATGSITVRHNTPGGGSFNLPVTVRPPRPTAVVVAPDTIPGSTSATASVSFDLPGPATVTLSSSDATVASVPATAVRSGSTATFTVKTVQVATPHNITISASLNGVSTSKVIVVRPGRLTSVAANPSTVNAGESVPVTLTFDVPVSSVPVSIASTDTAIVARSVTASGTTVQVSLSTTKTLTRQVSATLSATAGSDTKSTTVQVNPIEISQFTVSPTSGTGGTNVAGTIRLTRTALQSQFLEFTSSDTTVAKAPPATSFNAGEDVKVVTITLRGPQSTTKSATITATVHASNSSASATVINSKPATVSATP